jgi:hypothetical protein
LLLIIFKQGLITANGSFNALCLVISCSPQRRFSGEEEYEEEEGIKSGV